jgi:lactoylglutathione lyase
MRTLHFGLRVADLDRTLAFYTAVGYEIVGRVPETPIGHLTMLKLPGDEFVTLELVHDPSTTDTSAPGFSHFAIRVESLEATMARLAAAGIDSDGSHSPAPDLHTTTVTDPDGRAIELVQWPAGHPEGMTAADWAGDEEDTP